jgi:hypothetical protein
MTASHSNIIYPDLSYKIMGAIFEVHKALGPGFLESIYEKALERFSIHHQAQLTSYLKASGYKLGILVNFSKSKVEYRRVLTR